MRRRFLFSLSMVVLVFAIAGCQSPEKVVMDPNMMQVKLVGTDTFPAEMVGWWYNKEYGWMFVFEPDGKLMKITHTIGRQDISPGQTAKVPLKLRGNAFFKPGHWLVHYDASTRELVVHVTLESFKYRIEKSEVYGSSSDIFTGTLPEKGQSLWRANWTSFPEYFFDLPGTSYKDYRLPVEDKEPEDRGEIMFMKFDPNDVAQTQ